MTSCLAESGGGYNGWRNYETWTVALWLDNERTSYEYWREEARRCQRKAMTDPRVKDGIWTPKEAAMFNLADQLRDELTDGIPLAAPTMYADLLRAALTEVEWQEVAAILLAELE